MKICGTLRKVLGSFLEGDNVIVLLFLFLFYGLSD